MLKILVLIGNHKKSKNVYGKMIIRIAKDNQDREFTKENISDLMWKKFALKQMNAHSYFAAAFQREIND
jgi:hypothetical protein